MSSTQPVVPGHTRELGKGKQELFSITVVTIQKTVDWKLPETTGYSMNLTLSPRPWISTMKQGCLLVPLTKLEIQLVMFMIQEGCKYCS